LIYTAGQIVEGARDHDGFSSTRYQKQVCISVHHDSDLPITNMKHPLEYVGRMLRLGSLEVAAVPTSQPSIWKKIYLEVAHEGTSIASVSSTGI
jgi:hypothetical protein